MRIKPSVIYQWAKTYQTTQGYIIRVKMKLQRISRINKKEFPQDYKFNWIAYNVENANERVLFDNHHGKPPHYHIDKDKKALLLLGCHGKNLKLYSENKLTKDLVILKKSI